MHWNELDIVEGTISKGRGKAAILPQKMIEKGIVVRASIKSQSRRDSPTYSRVSNNRTTPIKRT